MKSFMLFLYLLTLSSVSIFVILKHTHTRTDKQPTTQTRASMQKLYVVVSVMAVVKVKEPTMLNNKEKRFVRDFVRLREDVQGGPVVQLLKHLTPTQ